MRHFIAATLLIAALVHLLPVVGVFGPAPLAALYGIAISDPDTEILMRHRAVLFGLLGVFLGVAAFHAPFQAAGFVAGLVSVLAFLLIALSVGQYNALLSRVVMADVFAAVVLVAGGLALALSRRAG
jgi:hypothetical protein